MRASLVFAGIASMATLAGFALQDGFRREGEGAVRAAKNALEGKPPPALQVANWMNTKGKPLKWEDLKGKVVLINFWGTW